MDNKIYSAKITWLSLIPHIALCFIAVGFLTIWKPLIAIFTTTLDVYSTRISGKIGLFKTSSMDSPIKQVTSVKVSKSLFGNIFNYGTININTASGTFDFKYISHPDEVQRKIMELLS